MYHKLLLPNKCKKIGWMLFFPTTVAGLALLIGHYEPTWLNFRVWSLFPTLTSEEYCHTVRVNLANTITGIAFLVAALLIGFSSEPEEDEFTAKMRLSALLWAVLVNYSLLMLAFLVAFDLAFFTVMICNMFTVLLLFILRFQYLLRKNAKLYRHEE